jgi:D-alanyl-lipoteichoic acid acyltransferase DltB (MBOAT superfamily)
MLLGGLWHGAAWTFVLWGAYHGMLLCIHRFFRAVKDQTRFPKGTVAQSFGKALGWFACLNAVSLGWLVFRVPTIKQALDMIKAICTTWSYEIIWAYRGQGFRLLMFATPVLLMQFIQFLKNDLWAVCKANILLKVCIYVLMFYMLILWGVQGGEEFIYFRF